MQPAPYTPTAYSHMPPLGVAIQQTYIPQRVPTGSDSRHSSVSTYATSSNASLVEGYTSPSMSSGSDTDENGHGRRRGRSHNVSKNKKEKKHRADLGLAMQKKQHALECYVRFIHGNEQSAGNAKSSGLDFNKLDIENAFFANAVAAMDRLFKQALENDTVDELRAWFRRLLTGDPEQPGDVMDPTYNTLMYDAGPRCYPDANGSCFAHSEPDINRCRRTRAPATFDRNVELYLQECGPGSQKRRQA